jgi:hypothetical protein
VSCGLALRGFASCNASVTGSVFPAPGGTINAAGAPEPGAAPSAVVPTRVIVPAVGPNAGALPLLPPPPLMLHPLPPLPSPPPPLVLPPAAGPAGRGEVPVIPEAPAAGLLAAGLLGVAALACWRRR